MVRLTGGQATKIWLLFGHLEGAGRGVRAGLPGEVGVVDCGHAPAGPTEGAAHSEASSAGPAPRPAQQRALGSCVANSWRQADIKENTYPQSHL